MKTLEQKIAVMQSALDGAEIEVCGKQSDNWAKALEPCWDWAWNNYRIRTQPKEIWVNSTDDKKFHIGVYNTEEQAISKRTKPSGGLDDFVTTHYREVME